MANMGHYGTHYHGTNLILLQGNPWAHAVGHARATWRCLGTRGRCRRWWKEVPHTEKPVQSIIHTACLYNMFVRLRMCLYNVYVNVHLFILKHVMYPSLCDLTVKANLNTHVMSSIFKVCIFAQMGCHRNTFKRSTLLVWRTICFKIDAIWC